MAGKAANLALIIAAQVLALSLWFSGTAAGPGMAREAAAAAGAGASSSRPCPSRVATTRA